MSAKKTPHQERVESFMKLSKRKVPFFPEMPDRDARIFQAKAVLENALELIEGLGFKLVMSKNEEAGVPGRFGFEEHENGPDLIKIAGECANLSVATIGTLSACGISDLSLLMEVDEKNVGQFGPNGKRRPDPDEPNVVGVLKRQAP
jgi:predicted HAD superfamily Cof-like phosphohydrolase